MNIAVLGAADSWYLQDLVRAAGDRHAIIRAPFCSLASRVSPDCSTVSTAGVALTACDGVLVRTMPAGSLEQVVFRMDALGRLESAGVAVVNPPKAIEAAVDKYLTTSRLAAAGLAVPSTLACQTTDEAMAAFAELGGDVVVKPLFGAEGRGIARLQDEALAWRAFKTLEQHRAVIYLQPYIPHLGYDWRLLVVGQRVLGIKRIHPTDWRTNVSRGATTEPIEVSEQLAALARRAAASVGAVLAGVDVLPARDGRYYVLEVNAVPGWRALARTLNVDVARMVLDYVCCPD